METDHRGKRRGGRRYWHDPSMPKYASLPLRRLPATSGQAPERALHEHVPVGHRGRLVCSGAAYREIQPLRVGPVHPTFGTPSGPGLGKSQ